MAVAWGYSRVFDATVSISPQLPVSGRVRFSGIANGMGYPMEEINCSTSMPSSQPCDPRGKNGGGDDGGLRICDIECTGSIQVSSFNWIKMFQPNVSCCGVL